MRAQDRFAVVTLVLVALALAAPLWGPGMVNTRGGGDSPFLLQRTHQMVANLRAGVFPVRWMPDAAYGLGYPFFNYYSSLPYYLAAGLVLIGANLLVAIKFVQTVGFVAAALAMYGMVRQMTGSRWMAWLAGIAYAAAPFHLVNVYVRGDSLSEFYAFIFYPLIIWGLDRILRDEVPGSDSWWSGRWWIAALWPALAYAGLVASHNISALIFSPFVLLYPLAALVRGETGWPDVTLCYLSLGLGLLLSAWVWVPALAETDLVQTASLVDDYFHYSHHFRTLDLVQQSALFGYSVAPGGDSPFAMGLMQAIFGALGAVALVLRGLRAPIGGRGFGRASGRWWFLMLGLLISTAMITPLSEPLWKYLPLLAMIQFPWRFLSVQAFFVAVATAALVPPVTRSLWLGGPIAVLLVSTMLLPLAPDRLPISAGDVTVERLQLYELFTQNIGTTIRYEWLPVGVVPRPFISDAVVDPAAPARAIPLDGSVEAALVGRWPTRQLWQVRGGGGAVAIPLLYWPGWRAQVDGEDVGVWAVDGSGYLALAVPPGEHTILLRLGPTTVRSVAGILSLGALLLSVGLLLLARRAVPWRAALKWLSVVIAPGLFMVFLPQNVYCEPGDLTMDFDQAPYLHHGAGGWAAGRGIPFDDDVWLERYDLSADVLSPGDILTVTLGLENLNAGHRVSVRLVSPAALRHEVEPLTEAIVYGNHVRQVHLGLPDDTSRGVYLLQVRVFGAEGELRSRTAAGHSRGVLYLRAVRVVRGPELPSTTSVLAPFGPAIRLYAGSVSPLDDGKLSVRLAWSTDAPIAANYGISLRIVDPAGNAVVQFDTQPGYGFLPTSMWRPGEAIADRYVLDVPADIPAADGYRLLVILYRVDTGQPIGQAYLGGFRLPLEATFEARRPPRSFALPPLPQERSVDFGGQIRLAAHQLKQQEQAILLTLWWQAQTSPAQDYTVFVHLFNPETEQIPVQSDAMPQGGGYPTSWWASGEVVSETVSLSLAEVPPGEYRVAVGLYDQSGTRMAAVDAEGHAVENGRAVLEETVWVP